MGIEQLWKALRHRAISAHGPQDPDEVAAIGQQISHDKRATQNLIYVQCGTMSANKS